TNTYTTNPGGAFIPDNNPAGTTIPLDVPDNGTIQAVQVHVEITHTYRGDLSIEIISPAGTHVVLKALNGNDGAHDVIGTFGASLTSVGNLNSLAGQNQAGTWNLFVVDHFQQDTGNVNAFTIT